jgi:hypothetical protein
MKEKDFLNSLENLSGKVAVVVGYEIITAMQSQTIELTNALVEVVVLGKKQSYISHCVEQQYLLVLLISPESVMEWKRRERLWNEKQLNPHFRGRYSSIHVI